MKLRVRSELVYRFDPPTDAIFQIHAAHWPGQQVLEETLVITPPVQFRQDETIEFGTRPMRARLSGEVTVLYEALVDNGLLTGLPRGAVQHDWTDLPVDALTYLWPSRYCPSDQFGRFVEREFGTLFEVWLSDGWWLIDPTGLAPIAGLVRIASGRDAADIAFLSTQDMCEMVRQAITVEAV